MEMNSIKDLDKDFESSQKSLVLDQTLSSNFQLKIFTQRKRHPKVPFLDETFNYAAVQPLKYFT